jgi:hypothetical protein
VQTCQYLVLWPRCRVSPATDDSTGVQVSHIDGLESLVLELVSYGRWGTCKWKIVSTYPILPMMKQASRCFGYSGMVYLADPAAVTKIGVAQTR